MIEQGTQAWLEARRGKVTASQVYKLINLKNPEATFSETALTYMHRLIAERMGATIEELNLEVLEYGKEQEPYARQAYRNKTDRLVFDAPFRTLSGHGYVGASPDGLSFENDDPLENPYLGQEIKCPVKEEKHVAYMLGKMPKEYYAQMQLNMLVHNVDKWDFISYHPNFKDKSLFITTVDADKEYQKIMLDRCIRFEKELQEKLTQLREAA
jgi:putative phage-type endonuclease